MVEALHGQFPGHRFRRTSGVDSHHDQVRFGWVFAAPDGSVTAAGIDIGLVGDGDDLAALVGGEGGSVILLVRLAAGHQEHAIARLRFAALPEQDRIAVVELLKSLLLFALPEDGEE